MTTADDSRIREVLVPEPIQKLLSETSEAPDCFIQQRFSRNLQAFLVGYTNSIYSNYSVADS